jgi:hypothetical protein
MVTCTASARVRLAALSGLLPATSSAGPCNLGVHLIRHLSTSQASQKSKDAIIIPERGCARCAREGRQRAHSALKPPLWTPRQRMGTLSPSLGPRLPWRIAGERRVDQNKRMQLNPGATLAWAAVVTTSPAVKAVAGPSPFGVSCIRRTEQRLQPLRSAIPYICIAPANKAAQYRLSANAKLSCREHASCHPGHVSAAIHAHGPRRTLGMKDGNNVSAGPRASKITSR